MFFLIFLFLLIFNEFSLLYGKILCIVDLINLLGKEIIGYFDVLWLNRSIKYFNGFNFLLKKTTKNMHCDIDIMHMQ